jgi:hypothetical protein
MHPNGHGAMTEAWPINERLLTDDKRVCLFSALGCEEHLFVVADFARFQEFQDGCISSISLQQPDTVCVSGSIEANILAEWMPAKESLLHDFSVLQTDDRNPFSRASGRFGHDSNELVTGT